MVTILCLCQVKASVKVYILTSSALTLKQHQSFHTTICILILLFCILYVINDYFVRGRLFSKYYKLIMHTINGVSQR